MTYEKKRVLVAIAIAVAAVVIASSVNAGVQRLFAGGDTGDDAAQVSESQIQATGEETADAEKAFSEYAGTSWTDGEGNWMYIQNGYLGEWNDETDELKYYRITSGKADDNGNVEVSLVVSKDDIKASSGTSANITIEAKDNGEKHISGTALAHEYTLRENSSGNIKLTDFDASLDIWKGHTEKEFKKAIEKAVTTSEATEASWSKGVTVTYSSGEIISTSFTLNDPGMSVVTVMIRNGKVTANM